MNVLIVKHGALGDVVRTSYFAGALRLRHGAALRLAWITAAASRPLISHNPHIDQIVTSFDELSGTVFDIVYSLDDEIDVLQGVARIQARRVVGAYLDGESIRYSADSAEWFDMGLRSRFGKAQADELKKVNTRGHAEIFSRIFEVDAPSVEFFGDPQLEDWARRRFAPRARWIGVNPFAGGRWPSKELRAAELRSLLAGLLMRDGSDRSPLRVLLLGAGPDLQRNRELETEIADPRIVAVDTDDSVLRLAAVIGRLGLVISSDSLALHLAIAQRVPAVAFFAPTSAAEIDVFGRGVKVASRASDYCSYRPQADNSDITAYRLLEAADALLRDAAGGTAAAG